MNLCHVWQFKPFSTFYCISHPPQNHACIFNHYKVRRLGKQRRSYVANNVDTPRLDTPLRAFFFFFFFFTFLVTPFRREFVGKKAKRGQKSCPLVKHREKSTKGIHKRMLFCSISVIFTTRDTQFSENR